MFDSAASHTPDVVEYVLIWEQVFVMYTRNVFVCVFEWGVVKLV